jgi:acyl-CoA thioester hydrolase
MRAAFFPEGPPPPTPARERFPEAPPDPPGAYRESRRAEWRDIDAAGHVNNTVYLAYIRECALASLAACGWPVSRLEAEGVALATRYHRIEYRLPALLDDELEIATWLSDVQGATAIRHTFITRPVDSATIMRARTVHGWVEPETGDPTTMPESLGADMAPTIAG